MSEEKFELPANLAADGALYFAPLGGAGEFGVNMNAYGYEQNWILIDCGLGFADETLPGIDIVLPDPKFITERRNQLQGLVITHGHEDHIGAVAQLWPMLKCPIYATPFTADLIRTKLQEQEIDRRVEIIEVPLNSPIKLGTFELTWIPVTHSIPEACMIAVKTPVGTLLHTGDWKMDQNPVVGTPTDIAAIKALGQNEKIIALVGDSTNSMSEGRSGSELTLQENLVKVFAEFKENRIAVTGFASNVARLKSIAMAAMANGRQVGLAGRSLWRIADIARQHGYLEGVPEFLNEKDSMMTKRNDIVMVCTGSQGEARAAMARIAKGEHPHVQLHRGDTAIFSARPIPGNEKGIGKVQSQLEARGVQVVTEADHFVHVSGHPCRDEMKDLYEWTKPRLVIPVHGERDQLAAHAKLASECGVQQTLQLFNGDVVRITADDAQIVGKTKTGLLCVDGKRIVPFSGTAIHGRAKLAQDGVAVVSIVLNSRGELLADPQLKVMGVLSDDEDARVHTKLVETLIKAVEDLSDSAASNDDAVRQAARVALRKTLSQSHGKKPLTEVQIMRV